MAGPAGARWRERFVYVVAATLFGASGGCFARALADQSVGGKQAGLGVRGGRERLIVIVQGRGTGRVGGSTRCTGLGRWFGGEIFGWSEGGVFFARWTSLGRRWGEVG